MKEHEKAFEEWYYNQPAVQDKTYLRHVWSEAIKHVQNRKCEDCKRFINMEFEQVDNNNRESINKVRACQYTGFYNVPNDFSCKHWKEKTA